MSDPAVIAFDTVRIRHEDNEIDTPAEVTFSVDPGDVVLVLGPSGCGKSTLTLATVGLIPHALPAQLNGTVTVCGVDTANATVAELSEQVALVFQDPDAQLVTASVLDEVCFGPENRLMPTETVLANAERALRQVGLWERRHDNPDVLSGGGKQRLAIAAALAMDARLLVLDEPTANLDPAGIDEVYAVLGELIATSPERAVVLVEHNLDAAIDLVGRIVVLDAAGRVAFDGPAREVLHDHADALRTLGVWLPVATMAALRLRDAGILLDPLPTTPAELHNALASRAELPKLPGLPELPELPESAATTGRVAPVTAERTAADAPTGSTAAPAGGTESHPLIAVHDLTVHKRGVPILHDVALDVHAGDFLAVIGTNGAGKTTLVQAIAGVVPPPRGSVRVGDLDVGAARVRALSSQVGFVFQNPEHQFIAHTVFDELAHGLRIRKVAEAEVHSAVTAMMARFGLAALADAHPFLLSGGQKRRLSVGSALITGAPVVVLDEPTFGQDRERAAELLGILSDLRAAGTTVIVVTHDMQLVADYASHVAVLAGGRLLAADTAHAILSDAALLERAGLRVPPLARAMRGLQHPGWDAVVRLADLPAVAEVAP